MSSALQASDGPPPVPGYLRRLAQFIGILGKIAATA
jgi:hypothetical protein